MNNTKAGYRLSVLCFPNKGLRIVRDLISDEAQIKTTDEITNDFRISLNFLDYARLIKTIPSDWTTSRYARYLLETTPWCQTFCSLISNDNKTSQVIKKESNVSIPPAIGAWKKDLTITDLTVYWNSIFKLPFSIGFDYWMKMFQYKILHRILPTSCKLFQYGIKETDLCDYCKESRETILHIFL